MTGSDERLGRFRDDLQVLPIPKAGGQAFRIVDPTRTMTWELWEIEHAVARLLDGVRTADEVARACAARGFAVSADHVRSFHREMKGMGFVVVGDAPRVTSDATNHRSDAQRFIDEAEIYMASGRYELAKDLYEAALQIDESDIDADIGLSRCLKMLGLASPDESLSPGVAAMAADLASELDDDASALADLDSAFDTALSPPPSFNAKTGTAPTGTAPTGTAPPGIARPGIAPAMPAVGALPMGNNDDEPTDLPIVGGFLDTAPPPLTAPPAAPASITSPRARWGRRALLAASVALAVIVLGAIVVKMVQPASAPAGSATTTVPTTAATTTAATTTAATTTAASTTTTPISAPVAQATHPELAAVTAPAPGKLMKVFVKPAARAVAGQRLLGMNVGGKPRFVVAAVDGSFVPAVSLGARLKKDDVIGHIVDAGTWHLTARFESAKTEGAVCKLLAPAGVEVACRVVSSKDGEVVAAVAAVDAPWLTADGFSVEKLGLRLQLSAP